LPLIKIFTIFNKMRCSRCGYIGFKAGSKCDNCHAKLKVAKTTSIFGKKDDPSEVSFSINPHSEAGVAAAKILAAEYDETNGSNSHSTGNGPSPFINEKGEFNLDLSEVLKKEKPQAPIIDPAEFMPPPVQEELNFSDTLPGEIEELNEIDLGEIEVEGLGFDFDATDINEDEETEGTGLSIDEGIEEKPDSQETDLLEELVETTDPDEIKEITIPEDDEPVINLGELEDTTLSEIIGESKPSSEVPDLSIDLDENEAEHIREKEIEEPKLGIEDLGLELDTIENQNTQDNKLDIEGSSEKKN
jgi:hypothetical protein